jgi:hypothetical protein
MEHISFWLMLIDESTLKKTEILVDAGKEVGLKIIVQQTDYLLLSAYHNASKNWDRNIASR